MTRLSFAIVILIFFNPLTKLWEKIIDTPVGISMHLFGLPLNVYVPYAGVFLLILYSFIAWLVLTFALIGLEKYLETDLLHTLRLRNGMLYATRPLFINWPYYVSKYLFWFLIVKYLFVLLLQIILSTALPSIIESFLTQIIGPLSFNISTVFRSLISSLTGSNTSQQMQLFVASLGFLYLVLNRFFFIEKDQRHFRDLKAWQARRRSAAQKQLVS